MKKRIATYILTLALAALGSHVEAQSSAGIGGGSPPRPAMQAISAEYVVLDQNQPSDVAGAKAGIAESAGAMKRLAETKLSTAPPAGVMPSGAIEPAEPSGRADEMTTQRAWADIDYSWEATNLFHRPLYFEDVNAERYGNSALPALQPVFTSARFLATVPLLPYKMALDPPRESEYVLGYYRPGDRAPNLAYRPPLRLKPLLMQGVVVGGVIAVFP